MKSHTGQVDNKSAAIRMPGLKPLAPLQPNGRGIEIALELLEINLTLKRALRNVDPRIIQ